MTLCELGHLLSRTMATWHLLTAHEVQALLEEELGAELLSYGIDPSAERLGDDEYETALAELRSRQKAVAAESSPALASKIDQIRRTLAWHLHDVSLSA